MERGGLARWLLLGIAAFFMVTLLSKQCSKEESPPQALLYDDTEAPKQRAPEKVCELWSPEFRAQLTTRGASLKHFELLTAKYRKEGLGIDLSTTPDHEAYQQLRFDWRNEALEQQRGGKAPDWQVKYDLFDWKLERADGKTCSFSYRDDRVELTKTIRVTGRPYELEVKSRIKNLAKKPLTHALTVHTADWRSTKEIKGHMFRVSPFQTHVECVMQDADTERLAEGDFEPKDFQEEPAFAANSLNGGDWYEVRGTTDLAAVSNAYFTHAIVPVSEPKAPVCQLQVETRGNKTDPNSGAFYRARLAYPKQELPPGGSTDYVVLSYIGPKERDALAAAAGGEHNLVDLIDLGFFSVIAKVLVSFLLKVYSVIPNWGIAIILLTITARVLLFPLSVPMIRSSAKMRELKPEIDALNEKYKDDPQQKGLAQMELWRKHNVNPLKGCVPQLASMPVWFALYTTLRTAVELYNIPFLWFPDLSEPDPYYVLPFVIGGTSFLQQKLMPMTAGDPAQQKMMLYFMPGMFIVFMLFLPSGLGVYMFTNGVLGIAQQQIVEWHVRRSSSGGTAGKGGSDVKVRVTEDGQRGKRGKRGRRGKKDDTDGSARASDLSENRSLLEKGKA
jgi:YidC/Oxa1 family membrane protein insertase